MASLLRSCKFIRYFASFARNFTHGTGRQDAFEIPSYNSNSNVYAGLAIRALATQSANVRNDNSLERSIRRLDQDARRAGRISRRELDEVLEEIKQTRSATSSQSLMVIRCCGSLVPEEMPEVRTKLVQEIWNTLDTLGVPMDISHYNALLRVYLENEHQFSPSEFLADLERKGVEPNRVTYQRLVARHCQQGDMDGAAKILQIMRDQQHPVNESVFNSLVMGHAQSGDMESARGILGVMKQAGLEPGPDTYTALLVGHAKLGDMEAIRAILAECETQQVDLLDRDLMTVLHALATAGYTEHVQELIGHLKHQPGYNQDCVNLILRLVNAGKEDIGLQLLKTLSPISRPSAESQNVVIPTGTFFIKQLVKANRPVEKIVEICKYMQETDMHPRALLTAMEAALNVPNPEVSMNLAKTLQTEGLPLRQHYFWPLLAQHSKNGNPQGICEVLQAMQTFGVTPHRETLREYAVPGLPGTPDQKVSQLRAAGISSGSAACSVALNLLGEHKLKEAADIVSQYKGSYAFQLFRKPLTQAFVVNRDVSAFLRLLQIVITSTKIPAEEADADAEDSAITSSDTADMAGRVVLDCLKTFGSNKLEILQSILKGFVEFGIGVNTNVADQLQDILGAELTPEISTLLSKITSGTLVAQIPVSDDKFTTPNLEGRDLEILVKTLEAKGLPTRNARRQLLQYYCRTKNLEKAEEIKKGLESEGFVFSTGVLAGVMDLYCQHDMLNEVSALYKQLKEREPEFVPDSFKAIRMATLFIKHNKVEDAVEVLKSLPPRENVQEQVDRTLFALRALAWRLLNSLAEEGRVDDLQKIFDALIGSGNMPVNNVLLGPLIKVHLIKNDIKSALERFEWCCTQYHATPWKNEIACRLIQAEDPTSLQRLTDLSTQVHGEVNSLYDLVLSFVECGRIRQARRILETPGLRSRPFRLVAACQRFSEEGQISSLEGLVEATKDMNHLDRANIYLHLLNTYCKAGDFDKALGLWTQAQEENVETSDEFLIKLGNLLKEHGQPVPFAIPEIVKEAEIQPKVAESVKQTPKIPKLSPASMDSSSEHALLRQAIRVKNLDGALDLKRSMELQGKFLSVRDSSSLIEALAVAERVGEATKIVRDMLSRSMHPLPRVFRFVLNKLALAGDVDTIAAIGAQLDDEKKKLVSFDNRMCNAHIIAGRAKEYLAGIRKCIEDAKTPEEITRISDSFPRGGAIGILEKHPELESDFAELGLKFAEQGNSAPINVLWMHYFVTDRPKEAQEIWDNYLVDTPRLMFQWVCQSSRRNSNPDLAANLFAILATSHSATPGARGNALSCLLDVLTAEKKFDEALASLTAAVKDVSLDYVNRTALQRLKTGLEEQGKKFPFTIPAKSASKASSSSSDDEEKH